MLLFTGLSTYRKILFSILGLEMVSESQTAEPST